VTKRRREYRSGGLTQRKDGIWVGTVEAGWTDGAKRKRLAVSSKDKGTAERKLRDLRLRLQLAGQQQVNSRATVKSWAEEWLPIQERRLRPNSYTATRSAIQKWVVPTIGQRRLAQLAPGDIRAVEAAQRKAGRSTSTMLRTHSVLMSLLNAAVIEGHPIAPGVLKVARPTVAVNDRSDIATIQAVALLTQAATQPDASRWVAAFLQGMRQAECLGLTWDQVDTVNGTLTVSWQLQPLPYRIPRDRASGFRIPDGYEVRQVDGALHLVRPKSRSGWRVYPLVPWMASALETWRTVAPTSPHGLVWCRPDGRPIRARDDDTAWYALQDAAGVRHPTRLDDDGNPAHFTIHEARHTTAALLLDLGVDPAIIAAIMGQSKLVKAYLHVKSPQIRAALEKVTERLALPSG
jgi:integrase